MSDNTTIHIHTPVHVHTMENGTFLYRSPNGVGGHTYFSDAIGGGAMIWDTCIASEEELLAAIEVERRLRALEKEK